MLKHFPHFAHGNFLGRRYFLLSLYSLVTNLLCTGTVTGLITDGLLLEVGAVDVYATVSLILGLSGTNAAFSAVGSSSGGGISSLRDRSAAIAIFVSSSVASTVNVPIVGGSASSTVGVDVEAFDSVQDTCTCVFLVIVVVVCPADRGDIILHFLRASRTVFDGLRNRFGLRRLRGGDSSSVWAANWE